MKKQLLELHGKVEKFFEARRKEATLGRAVGLWLLASLLWTVLNPVGLRSLLQINFLVLFLHLRLLREYSLLMRDCFIFWLREVMAGKVVFITFYTCFPLC